MPDLRQMVQQARNAGTPLVAIQTPDPASTIDMVRGLLKPEDPVFEWDAARGMRGLTDASMHALGLWGADPRQLVVLPEMLKVAATATTRRSVIFVHNAHRFLDNTVILQAVWNCRDEFKQNLRMLVLLGPVFRLPLELTNDITLMNEPYPTRDELAKQVRAQYKRSNEALPPGEQLVPPTPDTMREITDALVGLSGYAAESVTALSLGKKGVNVAQCWDRKITAIEQTEGLTVWRGRASLDDLVGLDQVVSYGRELAKARAFELVVFIDEIEKAIAGGMSDHVGDSGVSKDQVGQLLSYMEDEDALGLLLAGLAGCGKSQFAKAIGGDSGKPVVRFDLGGMKSSKVGGSEERIRAALKMITAIAAGGRVLVIGTANNSASFTPEMNRRFADQFFFDLLDEKARKAAWDIYIQKFKLTPEQTRVIPNDEGWNGSEIRMACRKADILHQSLEHVAQYMVPASVSGKTLIDERRREATGKFLSASYPGLYHPPQATKRGRTSRETEPLQ